MGGGHYARVQLTVTDGLVDRDATVESIAANASTILDSAASPVGGAQGSDRDAPDVRGVPPLVTAA